MPMEKGRYPADWKRIALGVKEAAGWRCQQCGKQCRRPGERLDAPGKAGHQFTLTVHHKDHQPENCSAETKETRRTGMKQRYTIRVESDNPEFNTDSELLEGIQVNGFFLVAIRDGKPAMECINGMTIMDLARFFTTGSEIYSVLRQAGAIAEGMRNAEAIQKEMEEQQNKRKVADIIAEKLGRISAEDLQ